MVYDQMASQTKPRERQREEAATKYPFRILEGAEHVLALHGRKMQLRK
jgi:hypothetical protein